MAGFVAILLLVVAVLGCALPAWPQPSRRMPVLAVLEPGSAERPAPAMPWFWQGFRDLGWQEGKNVIVEIRYADWKLDRLPGLLLELTRLKPDVLYTHSTAAVEALKQTPITIPVVIGVAGDLVGMGVVASLARPGGHITGMTSISPQLDPKRLELLREVVPRMSRLGVLGYVTNPSPVMLEEAARAVGLQLRRTVVRAAAEIDGAFDTMGRSGVEAVLVEDSALLAANRERVTSLSLKHRLPSMSQIPEFAEAGGLCQYGADVNDIFRRSAILVDKVLRGAKPADLPVEQPSKLALTVNLKTARALGITIPPSVLVRADRVIQ